MIKQSFKTISHRTGRLADTLPAVRVSPWLRPSVMLKLTPPMPSALWAQACPQCGGLRLRPGVMLEADSRCRQRCGRGRPARSAGVSSFGPALCWKPTPRYRQRCGRGRPARSAGVSGSARRWLLSRPPMPSALWAEACHSAGSRLPAGAMLENRLLDTVSATSRHQILTTSSRCRTTIATCTDLTALARRFCLWQEADVLLRAVRPPRRLRSDNRVAHSRPDRPGQVRSRAALPAPHSQRQRQIGAHLLSGPPSVKERPYPGTRGARHYSRFAGGNVTIHGGIPGSGKRFPRRKPPVPGYR